MKLSSFIQSDMEAILAEWDVFARANEPVEGGMSDRSLRDHARAMLEDVAREMETAQSEEERQLKSEGNESPSRRGPSAAAKHGRERQSNDFTLVKLGAEFRALRATVLRLWQPHLDVVDAQALEQVIRFNEGMDKALADSIQSWSERADHLRELFLAILGHDLRSPLASIALAGDTLARPGIAPEKVNPLALTVTRATQVMTHMIHDLMGYASTQLGGAMPHHAQPCDLLQPLKDAIQDATATYPGTRFELHAPEALMGCYDATRLYQMFVNLLVNAARHGTDGCPVLVQAAAAPNGFQVTITNRGEPIPAASLESIFRPLVQLDAGDADPSRARTSLGLGLYIARKIAERHGGAIGVASSQAEGTCFSVSLPISAEDCAQG